MNLFCAFSRTIFENLPPIFGKTRTVLLSKIPFFLKNQGNFSKITLFVQKRGHHLKDNIFKCGLPNTQFTMGSDDTPIFFFQFCDTVLENQSVFLNFTDSPFSLQFRTSNHDKGSRHSASPLGYIICPCPHFDQWNLKHKYSILIMKIFGCKYFFLNESNIS